MNKDKIILLTNRVSLVSIILLIYWVFIFILHVVFEFKVFRENITQSFSLSVLGILALLTGAVIVNVMLNMTKISEALSAREEAEADATPRPESKRTLGIVLFFLSFPLIFLTLFLGDMRTSKMKEKHLIDSAKYMISNNQKMMAKLANYKFSKKYIAIACSSLRLLSKEDESFPSVYLIVQDRIEGKEVFLSFNEYCDDDPKKYEYIYSCSKEERQYLNRVLNEGHDEYKFSASDGSYELYYPAKSGEKAMVMYFTDRKRYGKFGS